MNSKDNPLLYLCFFFCLAPIVSIGQTVDANYLNPKNHTAGAYKFLRFGNSAQYWAGFMWNEGDANYGNGNDFTIFSCANRDIAVRTGTGNFIVFPSSGGNMGVGTVTPNSKMHIYNGASGHGPHGFADLSVEDDDAGKVSILIPNTQNAYYGFTDADDDFVGGIQYNHVNDIMYFRVNNHAADMVIDKDGNVGMGTSTPNSKLAVNGNIHAKEVEVDLIGWPDYVFKEEYDLPTLAKVEKYIKEKGHLINIPSANEVKENGVHLGEMNKLLLEKIEELTLYIIELKKENEEIKKLLKNEM